MKDRVKVFDILRLIAAFSVVMLHSSAGYWYDYPVNSGTFFAVNFIDGLFRFGVPIFMMISGALFLSGDCEVNIKTLLKKNVLRLAIMFVLWSILYGVKDVLTLAPYVDINVKFAIKECIQGRYHLWYLPIAVGMYLLVPILKKWVCHSSEKEVRYFVILFMIFQIARETFKAVFIGETASTVFGYMSFDLICGYAGYFVLGYYLFTYPLKKSLRISIYILCIPALLYNCVGSFLIQLWQGQRNGEIFDSYSISTFIVSAALFSLALALKEKVSRKETKLLTNLSKDTLGVYVIHVMILELKEMYLPVPDTGIMIVLDIFITAIAVYGISMLIAAGLRRIPFVGKYIC